jgi:2-methylcitrate dehydratase
MIGATFLKNYAVCYHAQAGAEAAIEIFGRLAGRPIEAIEVDAYGDAVRMIGRDPERWAPKSRETADHSLPFTVATCLIHGDLTADSFEESRLDEPAVVELMTKVVVREDPAFTALYPDAAPTRVTVRTAAGETLTHEVVHPKGHPRAPMTDAEIEHKFAKLAGSDCRSLLDALWTIDHAGNIGRDVIPVLVRNRARVSGTSIGLLV